MKKLKFRFLTASSTSSSSLTGRSTIHPVHPAVDDKTLILPLQNNLEIHRVQANRKNMSLIAKYESAIQSKDIADDCLQRKVIISLERITQELEFKRPWWDIIPQKPIRGLYIVGPVGVGKTYLMDLFYDNLTEKNKARFHFHHFMQQLDQKLRLLQGKSDPVVAVVKNLSKKVRVLCLDEFLIDDVAYAMIFAQLLKEMFKNKMVLIVTTNTKVDDLYLNGVRREQFLPAIDLLKKHCDIAYLSGDNDYRFGRGYEAHSYLYPLNSSTKQDLIRQFIKIDASPHENGEISILNRPIQFVKMSKTAIWFDFSVICNVPRCKLDYLEIANNYDTVFIENIPVLTSYDTIKVLLFMHLIDVAYDRGIRLVLSAEVAEEKLYTSGELLQPFSRTLSRIQEMQSQDYLRRHAYIPSTKEFY